MSKKMDDLREMAKNRGLYFDTYSPGQVGTKYRFFTDPKKCDYWEPDGGGIFTALGRAEAELFIKAFGLGRLN